MFSPAAIFFPSLSTTGPSHWGLKFRASFSSAADLLLAWQRQALFFVSGPKVRNPMLADFCCLPFGRYPDGDKFLSVREKPVMNALALLPSRRFSPTPFLPHSPICWRLPPASAGDLCRSGSPTPLFLKGATGASVHTLVRDSPQAVGSRHLFSFSPPFLCAALLSSHYA